MARYYQTTPIFYVNDVPHVGHAYVTIATDALCRARRLQGHEVFFLTGTDEHGQNIERIAREKGVATQAYCDQIAARFRALWERCDIEYDGFIRTTDAKHKRGVLELWKRLRKARTPDGRDAIYTGVYSGWYCPRCEAFKTEDELKQPGNVCPDHERPCEWTEEENFFFRLSAYSEWLRDEIASGRIRIDPETRRNEVLAVIRDGLQDFSVSRARVKWGIPVPEQPDHVFYVWIDALSNYITALGFAEDGDGRRDYERFWEHGGERLHFIGKEIIRFHCLYWPAVLHAADVRVPTRLYAHGHLTKNGKKLSKTTGNVIDPETLVSTHGPDAVRYFLLREGSFGDDWDFTETAFVTRYNADLANDLGNLVSRALTMVQRYCKGRVPPRPADPVPAPPVEGAGTPQALGYEEVLQTPAEQADGRVISESEREGRRVLARYEELDFSGALARVWSIISQLNQRIVQVEPWTLAKEPARSGELDAFLYRLVEGVRLIGVLVSPVIPRASARVFRMLGLRDATLGPSDLEWGRLVPGTPVGTIEPLFPRIEVAALTPGPSPSRRGEFKEKVLSDTRPRSEPKEKILSETPANPAASTPPAPPDDSSSAAVSAPAVAPSAAGDVIDISEFGRLDLRVGKVTSAEAVPKSKRLVRLQIDLGESEPRQVVAGIAEAYAPDALVGRTVVVVANLKPAKLMGVESRGMVLAASIDGRPVLCAFDQDVPPGTRVK